MGLTLPEESKIVEAITPQVGAAITGDYVNLKHAHNCFILVHVAQGNAAQMAITVEQATTVAGGGTTAITKVVPIWANEDQATSDTLVRQTDAVSFTLSVATTQKLVIFQVDPQTLNIADGFDCITVKTAASHADNLTSALYILAPLRIAGATPPSAIID